MGIVIDNLKEIVMKLINKNILKLVLNGCLLLSITLFHISCNKQIEVDAPITSTTSANVYTNDATASAVLTGIYTKMSSSNFSQGGLTSMSLFPSLSSDELTLFNLSNSLYLNYYRNKLSSVNAGDFWLKIYSIIFVTNSAIEGLTNSENLTPSVRQQLLGEAKFIRAFCYFYLTNLYGDVPVPVSTDWKINSLLARTPKTQVWQQIIADLKAAQNVLNSSYLNADVLTTTMERVRPTKWAATALLARAYLYTNKYDSAEIQASAIINNKNLYDTVPLNSVFLRNSREAIWQLQPVSVGVNSNTGEGRLFILPAAGPNSIFPVYLSNSVVNSFETGDQRKVNWTSKVTVGTNTFYYPYKYKIGSVNVSTSEYSTVLRLAEQYLIRAEARAHLNKINEANDDINIIRTRAGLPNINANDQSSLLAAILHERQVELFTEWGHRWLDLKRTNTIDALMNIVAPQKGGIWNTNWQWYPIPLTELQNDPNLTQNAGYQ